jgi:UDPglucose 6-dehydrogenase
VSRLLAAGATVTAYDPTVTAPSPSIPSGVQIVGDVVAAAKGAACLVVLTEWLEFAATDPDEVAAVVAERRVFDGRNVLEADAWIDRGFSYARIGR